MTKTKNNMMQLLVNSMPGIVFWKSLDLHYLGANQKFLQFLGLDNQKQLIGKKDEDLNCSQQKRDYLSKFDFLILQTEEPQYSIEESFLEENNFITLITDKHPLYDDNHKLIGVLSLSSIEDDKHATVQTYLENIVASVPYYIFWKNTNSIYLGCNKKFSSLVNKTPNEVIGKSDLELGWEAGEAALFIQGDKEVMSGKSKVNVEELLIQPDGSKTIMLVSKVPVFDKNDKCIGVLGVSIDITDRKKMEQDLIIARDAAESANKAKTEFITNMSHDIRTPLSGVVGMSKILEDKANDAEEKQYAHWVVESGEQLLRLLNDIMDVISADHVNDNDLRMECFDLHECIADIAQLELPTIKMKNLDLQINIHKEVPKYLISDRTKLHRIILNLLGNSIKFTNEGHVGITITLVERHNDSVRLGFCISDTGIGIPNDLQDSVFDRFFRVNPSWKGTYNGNGIGLHIAQSYVKLLGSELKLTSQVNLGTQFTFELLFKIGYERDITNETQHLAGIENEKKSLMIETTPANATVPDLLLIEDNYIALRTIELLTKEAGYRYTSVDNAEQALELIQTKHFDLILTDIGLPGMSGMELTQEIRKWEHVNKRKKIPIAGLTAHTRKDEANKCLASGMDKILIKPASLSMIRNLVNEFVTQNLSVNKSKDDKNVPISDELPDNEEALFQLDSFPILDVENGINILGSKDLLKEMIELMLNEVIDKDKMAIEQAYAANDWPQVETLVHKMKGGAAYCGTIKMHRACQYLERYQKAGQSKLLEPLYHQFLKATDETKAYLTDWLCNLDKSNLQ